MSKHTDTGRAGTRRGGKKLWILIPVIAVLIIAAALVWLNSVYVYAGGLHRRDSAQIDLRGEDGIAFPATETTKNAFVEGDARTQALFRWIRANVRQPET